jgi:hypothetical protein
MGFVVEKGVAGQIFSECFSFPCQALHQLHHTHHHHHHPELVNRPFSGVSNSGLGSGFKR